ncbi:MAG: FHA domain-containing protein [Synechococcales bacterium]|nr:FHA domain-containing protein [Synechococcales bacterium]
MIVCPHCNHQNPEGAVQCEACYTPLPAMTTCPSCGAAVQADASFCGQCGAPLEQPQPQEVAAAADLPPASSPTYTMAPDMNLPDLASPEPLVEPEPLMEPAIASDLEPAIASDLPETEPPLAPPPPPKMPPSVAGFPKTQIQVQTAQLLHIRTTMVVEIPQNLSVIHIGKPNDRVPPDIDVSGFPDSEVVSRIHADIRLEGDTFYIEDVGSSNGTYINNTPLSVGNRHRLRSGDRIALGKGDKVAFLFQIV